MLASGALRWHAWCPLRACSEIHSVAERLGSSSPVAQMPEELCAGTAVLIAALVMTVTAGAVAWKLSMLDINQSGSIASTCTQGLQCL